MIKKILSVIRTFKEAAMVRNSVLHIDLAEYYKLPEHHGGRKRTKLEKGIKNIALKRKAKKLHRDILSGKAPRGRT